MNEHHHVEPVEKAVTVRQLREANRAILSIGGMGCPNCAVRVHNSLIAVDGVYRADVYLEYSVADVFYDCHAVTLDILKQAVRRAGHDGQHDYFALVIAHD